MLYIIATPIGNLQDITFRAIETFKKCDYILCEDTRKSSVLLNYYQISTKLISYHKFNEKFRLENIIADLSSGKNIGLISDAGTPTVSDPGNILIHECLKLNIKVEAIPGASAAITALSCAGIIADQFQFVGFLSRKNEKLRKQIESFSAYNGVTIFYESPHRLKKTLELILEIIPSAEVTVCRELTKKFEEVIKLPIEDQISYWNNKNIKGELTILISPVENNIEPPQDFDEMNKEIQILIEKGCHTNEAIKNLANKYNVPKSYLYKKYHND